ncbi:threonine synthase [Hallerella succinigenes]|uniref:Threonine synthase n=1 Tax=Hallerella succinigenes TaxID=1896222 RepID=A0A2M9A4K0_9BACT|nr:threonine synthase [Hallerella succinigenes]PJJ40557.1 L-threonine synthase [Hallerella succinigenes]
MKPFHAYFQNINGTDTYPLDEVIYRSKVDNSLLEVHHDREALAERSPEEWKKLFAERRMSFKPEDMSGIWSKREMVLPEMPVEDIVTMREGWSPLFDAAPLAKELGIKSLKVKLCGNSHTGSFKDLGMTVLVSQVNHIIKKQIHEIDAVACASTGDTSAALSAYCAKAGIPSIVFLPAGKTSTAQLIQPISNGSIVLALDTDFDGCMKIVQEVTKDNRIYLANSMNSLRVEGQKTISPEICQELGWKVPDVVIIPGGNLGNVSALAKGFEDCKAMGLINKIPRIVVAQAEHANPFYQAYERGFDKLVPVQAKKTLASAIQIGNPVSYPKAVRAIQNTNGIVVSVTEEELANAAHRADRIGLYACPHTGVALGGLEKLVAAGKIDKEEAVIVISTAHGLKFTEFKVGYHEQKLEGIQSKFANPIFKAPAEIGAVMDILKKEMANRRR